jgi:hypothetical protein
MKIRKILSLLAIPAALACMSSRSEAFMTVPTDGSLDACVKMQGKNGPIFQGKIVAKDPAKSCDGKFGAWQYTIEGQVLKDYPDPATGVNHEVGETGKFQFLTVNLPGFKGPPTPVVGFEGFIFLQGFSKDTCLTSVTTCGGMIPVVDGGDGKNYAVPPAGGAKLLRDPAGLSKALGTSSSGSKALGTPDQLNAAISRITAPQEAIEGKNLGEGTPVYKNYEAGDMATVIKALGVMYYGNPNK